MALFSKFKLAKSQPKDKGKDVQQAKEEPEKPKYVHVPKHAAADAMTGAPPCWSQADRPRILEANQKRISREASRLSLQSIPRVQSSLSYVSYPANESTPLVTLPRNYSYSSMPGTSYQGSRHGSLADLRRSARHTGRHGEDLIPPLPRSSHYRATAGPSTIYGRGMSANTSASSIGSGLVMMPRRQLPASTSTSRDAPGPASIPDGQSTPGPSVLARRSTTDMIPSASSRPQSRHRGHIRRISPLNPAAFATKPAESVSSPTSTRSSSSVSSVTSEKSSVRSNDAMDSTAASSVARTPDLTTTKMEYQPPTGTKLAEALSAGSPLSTVAAATTPSERSSRAVFWKYNKKSARSSRFLEDDSLTVVAPATQQEAAFPPKLAVVADAIEIPNPPDYHKPSNVVTGHKASPKRAAAQEERPQEAKKGRWAWLSKTRVTIKV